MEVQVDLHIRAVSGADLITAEVAAAEVDLKTGAGIVVALAVTEDVRGCLGLHIEADSGVDPKATNDTRHKKVRKAEAMETATAEPQVVPEDKTRRVDGALLVESEAGPATKTAATSRPLNWVTMTNSQKSKWMKRHAK